MSAPCIRGIRYALPRTTRTLAELEAAGQLQSSAEMLGRFGFDRVCVATDETPAELAFTAAHRLIEEEGIDPDSIELLLHGGLATPLAFEAANAAWDGSASVRTTDRFKYPGTRLAHELGLENAAVIGLGQLACTTLFAAVRLARALCLAGDARRVLCVNSEFFPPDAGREAIFNCTSDAACALLVDADGPRRQVIASAHVTKGYYWDCDTQRNEIVASYFPTARHVVEQVLASAGWTAADVDWVIPHNVSLRSWEILFALLQLPNARLWSENIPRYGHTLAGDNFINLADAIAAGAVLPGQKLLLFSYGYGAHWTALAVTA